MQETSRSTRRRLLKAATAAGCISAAGLILGLSSRAKKSDAFRLVSETDRQRLLNGFYVFRHSFQSVNESAIGQASAQDFANLWEESGPTDNDRRHVASISAM